MQILERTNPQSDLGYIDYTSIQTPLKPTYFDYETKAAAIHSKHLLTHILQSAGVTTITQSILEQAAYLFAHNQPITRENLLL